MTVTAVVRVDLSTTVATVVPEVGAPEVYGAGITRSNVAEAIAPGGWRLPEHPRWMLLTPPDGFWCRAVKP